MIPAMAMITRRITRTMAVAGRTGSTMADRRFKSESAPDESDGAPAQGGPHLHEGEFRTVGRAGRLSVHTLDARALGMRGTVDPPSCMQVHYRSLRVVS